MPLAPDELAAFVADGVITKRGFVAPELIDRAAALVTDWYHTDMDQSQLVDYTQRTFAPEFGDHEDLLALFTRSRGDRPCPRTGRQLHADHHNPGAGRLVGKACGSECRGHGSGTPGRAWRCRGR